MPQHVDVPGQGVVEFPDGMADDAIARVIRLHTPEPEKKGSPEWVGWRNQRQKDLNEHAASPNQPQDKSFVRMLWDKVNPFGVVTAPGAGGGDQPGQGPIGKVIGGVVRAGADQAGKAVDSFKQGDYLEAAGHAGAAALPVVGPMAANFGEHLGTAAGAALGGTPDANATKEAATDALAAVLPAVGAKVLSKAGVSTTVPEKLQSSAETQYARVLNPTTKGNKLRTAEVVPELIDRGVVAPSLKSLQGKAQANIASVGQAIGDEWQNLPAGSSTPLQPIFDRLQTEIDSTHSIADASGKMIPKGPEGAKAIRNIESLQQVLMDVAEKDPKTGQLGIPVEKARDLRQYFDNVQKAAGSFEGKNLNDASTAAAHEVAANAIRQELGKQFPDIAKLNKEYSFWKNVDQVVSDTLTRRQGQSVPLGQKMAQAGGFVKGGPFGAEVMKGLTQVVQSPAWGTVSAVLKDRLADSLAKGNSLQTSSVVQQIKRAATVKVFSDQPQQTPELAAAPTK